MDVRGYVEVRLKSVSPCRVASQFQIKRDDFMVSNLPSIASELSVFEHIKVCVVLI
jgi:hypothetical protein